MGYPETGASTIKTAESTKTAKKLRQERLARFIEGNPMATDQELAATLGVSVSTVRLDRALMGVPELRERVRCMAQQANSKLRSLSRTAGAGARPLGALLRQDGAGLIALDDTHRNVRLQHYEPPAFNFLPQTSETVREPVENGVY